MTSVIDGTAPTARDGSTGPIGLAGKAAEGTAPGKIAQLGAKLREERQARGLSLDKAAGRCGVSKAMLSAIERGKRVPTIRILVMIAESYGTNVSSLLSEPAAEPDTSTITVLRAGARSKWTDSASGVARELLAPSFLARGIEILWFEIPVGGSNADLPPRHSGVLQHVTVVSGKLEIMVGGRSAVLGAGDSSAFAADASHGFHNVGVQPCSFFLVLDTGAPRWR